MDAMNSVRSLMIGVALAILALLPAGSAESAKLASWRVVLVAGDDSAAVFDNAVDKLAAILRGKPGIELYRLTSDRHLSSATRAIASARNIDLALKGTAAQG